MNWLSGLVLLPVLCALVTALPRPEDGQVAAGEEDSVVFFPDEIEERLPTEVRTRMRNPPRFRNRRKKNRRGNKNRPRNQQQPDEQDDGATTTTSSEASSFVFPDDDDDAGEEEEIIVPLTRPSSGDPDEPIPKDILDACLTEGAFPFNDLSQWQCYDLASQGPCNDTEWFVLDNTVTDFSVPPGVCKEKECPDGEVMFNGTCSLLESSIHCPTGMHLLSNPFGEGDCDCLSGFLPYEDSEDDELICYQPFLQGPCPEGEQFMEREPDEDNPLIAECVPTGCPLGQVKWSNGDCLKNMACTDIIVAYSEEKKSLECDDITIRQLLTLPIICEENESLSHSGECKEVTRISGGGKRRKRRLATSSRGLRSFLRQRFASTG